MVSPHSLFGENEEEPPQLGLVLSGGGARGIAHVGVLKALEELRIPIQAIAGTSMGAIAGGYYASGVTVEEMETWVAEADWKNLFSDRSPREQAVYSNKGSNIDTYMGIEFGLDGKQMKFPSNFISGRKLLFELRRMTFGNEYVRHFDDFTIPFRAIATDMETGERVVLDRGDLAMVLRSSIAFPGLVAPAMIGDRLLGDGFLTDNLPVDVAFSMGVDCILAVDVGETLRTRDAINSSFNITRQALVIMARQNTDRQINLLGEKDLLITPDLAGVGVTSFQNTAATIRAGYDAVMAQQEYFVKFQVSEEEYEKWTRSRHSDLVEEMNVANIAVESEGEISSETIAKRLGIRPNEPFTFDELDRGLGLVFDLGNLSMVDYRIYRENGEDTLLIETENDSIGPNYIRLGFDFATDLSGESEFTLRLQHDRTELNNLGAKLRIDFAIGEDTLVGAAWEQPLEYGRSLSWRAEASYQTDQIIARNGRGNGVGANTESFEFGLFAIKDFTSFAGLQVGPLIRQSFHDSTFPEVRAVGGVASFNFDKLDSLSFPSSGFQFSTTFESSYRDFGATDSFNKVYGSLLLPVSFDDKTILLSVRGGGRLGRPLPEFERFELGGFGSLSGTVRDSIYDQFAGRALLAFYEKIDELPSFIGSGIYAGFTVELGGAWAEASDIDFNSARWGTSLFLGADTILGPLYFGYGLGEGNEQSLYLYMGSIW